MTELEAPGVGEHPPPYMIFLVVFLFFLTGLLGFLICHLLKKKGYRCRTGDVDDEEEEEEEEEKIRGQAEDDDEENQDTVEQILKCILENEANMEAFNEMLGNHNICARHDPRLRKDSVSGVPPHHHTVHSGTDHNTCHLCAQIRSKKGRRQSRTPRFKQRPGEQTVFSVGRFRVTHTDKKLHGGPNPLASSGDQLDRSQDSDDKKDGGYTLRSMFKDARPSESTNGVAPNVGKRRKSVTIFGLRRGSDPVGIKGGQGTGRETGGVKFASKQQPVVLEEQVPAENNETFSEHDTKPGPRPETAILRQNMLCVTPQHEAKTASSVNSPSTQSGKQAQFSSSVPVDGSKHGPRPEPCTNLTIKPSIGSMVTSTPGSLLLPSPTWSGQTRNTTEKQANVQDNLFKKEDTYDPGPLQTSTPIGSIPVSIPGSTSVIPTNQPEPCSSAGFPVTHTPPDLSSSLDLEPGFGGSLALISLGSSPLSSFPVKTPSSSSSLKTPTSPLAVTRSPKLSTTNTAEAVKHAFSPALTPSPKLQSGRTMSSESPIPSSTFGISGNPLQAQSPSAILSASPKLDTKPVSPQTSSSSPADQYPFFRSLTLSPDNGTSLAKASMVSSPLFLTDLELEIERKRDGILQTAKHSPVVGEKVIPFKGSALFSPSDQPSAGRLSRLPLSPSSPLSPTSPVGTKVSSVTIVKASPDSKREFSVVTMVEDEDFLSSIKEQKRETSHLVTESDNAGIRPAVSHGEESSALGTAPAESHREETTGVEGRLMLYKDRCDMMEMEDIRGCKVMQVQEAEKVEEEMEKSEHRQSNQD